MTPRQEDQAVLGGDHAITGADAHHLDRERRRDPLTDAALRRDRCPECGEHIAGDGDVCRRCRP